MKTRTNTAQWDEKHKRWRIYVQKDGQRRNFYSSIPGRKGQREANAKADAWLEEGVASQGLRVSAAWTKYMEFQRAETSASSAARVQCTGENYILPTIGHLKVEAVTEEHLQRMINQAYKNGSLKKENQQRRPQQLPLSRKTLQTILFTVRSFFKFCRLILKCTTLNPENLKIPKSARYKGKTILQPESLAVLFSVDTTLERGRRVHDQYIYAYRFQVSCGLRPGELAGLRVGDINPKTGEVRIQRALNTSREITSGKNENAVRSFIMPPQARDAYQAQMQYLNEQKIPINFNTPLFCIHSQHTYYGHWTRYLASNHLPHISPYELRHTFVSIAKNLPEGLVRPLVGHSRNMDTFGQYGHAIKGEAEQTADQLGSLFTAILAPKIQA